ncbi:MAG: ATP-binding cassette domain-containing protein [Clostridiales Family XIII bacterium]|jgi:lincosamide and streptogramin A transport system ATP-binding/permease protein|nr:ATP-binding cassette domain-containing protein [Clostridiales Family XIII bacterium]
MSAISIENLTFGWVGNTENVFDNVSFAMDTDWRTGLIGRNGRGKTTLMRLLADSGEMPHGGTISSPTGFRYFPYDIPDASLSTQDAIDAVCPVYEFWELCRELNLLGVSEDTLFRPFETLSPGERTKIMLATLFIGNGDFVLMDEPTNHLDADGTLAVVSYLRSKKGFLIASHDRSVLDALCDHIVSIGRTGIDVLGGNYSTWAEENRRRNNRERNEKAQLLKDVNKMQEAARHTAEWSKKTEASKYGNGPVDRGFIGHRAAKLMKRSKAVEARRNDAIEKKSKLLKNIENVGELKLTPLRHHAETLVEINDVQIEYLSDKVFDLRIGRGERIAVTGNNGAGKSSIVKLIAGESIPHCGEIKTASGLLTSYIPQETANPSGSVRSFAQDSGIDLTRFLTILINLGVERSAFDLDISLFSSGQKRKALLAKSLCQPAHLFLWDEPLNFLDIYAREQIEELLLAYDLTILFVEHDEYFTKKVATRTISVNSAND